MLTEKVSVEALVKLLFDSNMRPFNARDGGGGGRVGSTLIVAAGEPPEERERAAPLSAQADRHRVDEIGRDAQRCCQLR